MTCYFHLSIYILFCFHFDVQKCHQDVVLFVVSVSYLFPSDTLCALSVCWNIISNFKKIFFLCIFICISFSKLNLTFLYVESLCNHLPYVYCFLLFDFEFLYFCTELWQLFDPFVFFFASLYSATKCFYLKKMEIFLMCSSLCLICTTSYHFILLFFQLSFHSFILCLFKNLYYFLIHYFIFPVFSYLSLTIAGIFLTFVFQISQTLILSTIWLPTIFYFKYVRLFSLEIIVYRVGPYFSGKWALNSFL